MKLRLRRLLGGRASSKLKSEVPDVAEVSTISSGTASSYDEDSLYANSLGDPYADVRERMEALSAQCRMNHDNAQHEEIKIPVWIAFTTYVGYATFILWGHLRDFFALVFRRGRFLRRNNGLPGDNLKLFAPLLKSWEHFYTRRLYTRVQDAFNRPIASNPGAHIDVLERVSDDGQKSMKVLGAIDTMDNQEAMMAFKNQSHFITAVDGSAARMCLNLGSYNYLGFADDWHETCGTLVKGSLDNFSVSTASCRNEYGTTALHRQVETTVAQFLGKEDAICLNMGFNTNATTIPALVSRGDLLISDEMNHTSIVNGARASGAAIRIFKHNDIKHLEEILQEAIVMGRPRTRRPWNKILVIVEGIYSMEGEYCDLKNVTRVCKRFGAYVYLDEAHSIGAMGATGRGCAEYTGVDTADIDIMMGTFTKSFGGMGGYIAADKETIGYLRHHCAGSYYHNSLSPAVCQQVVAAFKVIMGEDGTNIGRQKLQALRDNSNYFRMKLEDMGLQVLGQYDSPVMPVMLYNPTKIAAFSRECFRRGLAVVVVGFPAVPILMSRARFCISAGHTREDLDMALRELDEIATCLNLRYDRSFHG